MKTPIEPKDIKAGDLIRWESPDGEEAHETRISNPLRTGFSAGQHYLLDRPAPTIDLPTDGHCGLGWVTDDRDTVLGDFQWRRVHVEDGPIGQIVRRDIVAWVPATAVPTSALDELRAGAHEHRCAGIAKFLQAIDAAGDPR